MLRCNESILSDRGTQMKLRSAMPNKLIQQNGVPQGEVLSVALFSAKVSSLCKVIPRSISCCLYVEDVWIPLASLKMIRFEMELKITLKMSRWAGETVLDAFSKGPPVFPSYLIETCGCTRLMLLSSLRTSFLLLEMSESFTSPATWR